MPRALPLPALALTALAVSAFAANSVLCRLALRDGEMDPVEFTILRMTAAAMILTLVLRVRSGNFHAARSGNWPAAIWLFAYALTFSLAYVELETGTGALLLFGAVQVTMIGLGLWRGERPPPRAWLGLGLAFGGVAYLLSPGTHAPSAWPAVCMVAAGIAWGLYSLLGRHATDPGATTCGNFTRTLPLVLVLGLATSPPWLFSTSALISALASGALASGLGYILWYAALRYLDATPAAILQLLAPVLATFAGVVFLDESLTPRILIAAALVFLGVVLATTARRN